MKKNIFLALVLTIFSVNFVYAHDIWVARDGDVLVVKYGHGDKIDPYKPAYVKSAKAYDASGKEMQVAIKPQKTKAVLVPAQPPALIVVVFCSGAWVKTPEGWENVSKREAKNFIMSMKGVTFNKNLWQWSDHFSKPLGGKMEIVPLKNPLALKVGDKLPFQVLYDGKPLAGAAVICGGHGKEKEMKTNQDGRAEITIIKPGLNIVCATRKTNTPKDPDADELYEFANLTFEVK